MTTNDHVPGTPTADSRSQATVIAGGLSERQHKYLATLAKGGTWEKHNLPPLGWGEGSQLENHRLIEYKGQNGVCEYFAITELGESVLAALGDQPAAAGDELPNPFDEVDGVDLAIAALYSELMLNKSNILERAKPHMKAIDDARQESKTEIARLRGLCGQAASLLEDLQPRWSELNQGAIDQLRKAAKGGE